MDTMQFAQIFKSTYYLKVWSKTPLILYEMYTIQFIERALTVRLVTEQV